MVRPVIAVVGATATGKSQLALALASVLGHAQIVNADAMQLYQGMDIGTAKVPPEERRGIPHHQIDVLDPRQDASVAAYQHHARADLARVREAGDWAIVVGGSGLYVRALLDDLDFPGTDPAVRAALEARLAADGADALHRDLAARDPAAAARIDPRNVRRVVRALEVVMVTGRPFSAALPPPAHHLPTVQFGLRLPWELLDERIARRSAGMIAEGLVEEVANLGPLSRTAARATGYAQALEFLAGRAGEAETIEAIALATRQLARRQAKWFRRDDRTRWIDASDPDAALAAVVASLAPWLD